MAKNEPNPLEIFNFSKMHFSDVGKSYTHPGIDLNFLIPSRDPCEAFSLLIFDVVPSQ